MVVTRVFAILLTIACLFAGFASDVFAQAPTTVQLPSFQFFTVNTSVLVPDRGTMSLGGISRSGTSALSSGPYFPQTSTGSTMGGSNMGLGGMSIGVQINDMAELDAAVLAKTTSVAGNSKPPIVASSSPASQGIAEARRQHEQEVTTVDAQARDYYQRGLMAESQGQVGAAKVWYQMASRRATGSFKGEIEARLSSLTRPSTASARR